MDDFSMPITTRQDIAVGALLASLLLASVWHDLRGRRIPNAIVFPGAALALALHSVLPAGIGFADSAAGLATGLALLLPLYLLRAAGAGDVKLMAMVGAFLGPVDVIGAVLCTFVAGALLALTVSVKSGVLREVAGNVRLIVYSAIARLSAAHGPEFDARTASAAKLPYAVAIAAGTFGFLALKHYG